MHICFATMGVTVEYRYLPLQHKERWRFCT